MVCKLGACGGADREEEGQLHSTLDTILSILVLLFVWVTSEILQSVSHPRGIFY